MPTYTEWRVRLVMVRVLWESLGREKLKCLGGIISMISIVLFTIQYKCQSGLLERLLINYNQRIYYAKLWP